MSEKRLKYVECNQPGFHYGEFINMVCMQPSCLQDLTCCCACIEEKHKSHQTKPIKILIKQASRYLNKIDSGPINIQNSMKHVIDSENKILEKFIAGKQEIIKSLDKVENIIKDYFISVKEQVRLKGLDPKRQLENAIETIYSYPNHTTFKDAIKLLVTMVPPKDKVVLNPETENEVFDSVQCSSQELNNMVNKSIEEIKKKMCQLQETLNLSINPKNLWIKSVYKFSSVFKHQNVKLVSDCIVKSINTSGYKFSVMEPGLETGSKQKTFCFNIKQSMSNWVAIGMCHRNIISSKNYGFSFGGIGHGAYLISSNGGSWSNINPQLNNSIKAFKFIKNDIIIMKVNLELKKINFQCKQQLFQLDFQCIEGDQLYPCALFYYLNDEVEFLPNYKPQNV